MVNDINSITGGAAGSSRQTSQKQAADLAAAKPGNSDTQAGTAARPTTGDTVQLSDQAQDIARIQRTLAQLPDIDQTKVSEIREQIANGSYKVDVQALADKILASDALFDS